MNPDTYIAPFFNKLLDKAERHIKYIVSTSSYVGNLQKKKEVLNARKNDINTRIDDEGGRRLQRPTEEVVVWRNQAVDMLDRIDTALNISQDAGSCVCSICSRHKLGHSCDDMIKEVDKLLWRASLSHNAEMVDCDTSNIAVPMPYVVAESQDSYFAEACKCIEDGSLNVNVIGIWGLGGVGKTTLLTKIHNHFIGNSSKFDTIIWTVASSEQSDISRVQSEIVKKLRLNETGDVHSQACLINRFLEDKNFLLFIDDLWKDVDLHKAGVPNPKEGNQCEKVGQEVIQSHSAIPKLAEDIAKECKGLPLALITIGRAMSTKLSIDDWKRTLNLFKDSQGLQDLGVDEQLLSVLKISYECLATDQLRKCFLTISMWPEDFIISERELIEFWMGIDLIDNFESKDEAYDFGHSLIRRLQAACLLEDVKYDSPLAYYETVKMHDVLRDLALWLASDCGKNKNKWMVKAGIKLQKAPNVKAKWLEAECISLMHNRIEGLPSGIPICPSLLTLVLRGNQITGKSCFGKFHRLNHLDLSRNCLKSFPESICDLTELRYLNLSFNEITYLPMNLRNLKMLRYLILRNNCITNIPRGVFTELAELLVLDMFEAFDIRNSTTWVDFEELKSIEKKLLSFGTTVRTEEELSKLMLLSELPIDALRIIDLRSPTFHFMAMIRNAHRLKVLHVKRCFNGLSEIVFDRNEIDHDFASLNLETLELVDVRRLKRIIWKEIAPKILFVELWKIEIGYCHLLEDITWVIHLPSLKYLSIFYCENMKIAINNDMYPQVLTFPSQEVFQLYGMDKLEKISSRPLAFPQLKQLQIMGCPLLKSLPLEVKTTSKLRKIEGARRWWEKVEWEDNNSRSHFNQFFNNLSFFE